MFNIMSMSIEKCFAAIHFCTIIILFIIAYMLFLFFEELQTLKASYAAAPVEYAPRLKPSEPPPRRERQRLQDEEEECFESEEEEERVEIPDDEPEDDEELPQIVEKVPMEAAKVPAVKRRPTRARKPS